MSGPDAALQLLFREAVIPLAWYDPNGRLIDANPASLAVFGVDSLDHIRGYSLFDDPFLPRAQKVQLERGEAVAYTVTVEFGRYQGAAEIHTTRRDSTRFLCRITPVDTEVPAGHAGYLVQLVELVPAPDTDTLPDSADGAEAPIAGEGMGTGVSAALSTAADPRRRAPRRRTDKEPDLYRLLADNSEDVIALSGSDLVPFFISPAIYRLTGYTVQELSPTAASALIVEEDRETLTAGIRRAFASGEQMFRFNYRIRRKDGEIRWVESRARRISLADGDWQVVSVNRDITETVRLRRELEESKARVEQLLAESRDLHREALHRMKNDIALVSALLGIQAHAATDPKVRGPIRDASSRVSVIAELYRNLDSGAGTPRHGVRTFIGSVLSGLRRSIIPDTVDLQWHAPEGELPARTLTTIGLITNELVTNAVKHGTGPDGSGRIVVNLGLDGERIRISVSDSGPGLPPELVSGTGGGTGLELVRTLASHHNGTVRIGGRVNSEVTVELPQRQQDPA